MTDPAAAKLRDIDFDAFGLSDEGKELMRGAMTPREYLGVLAEHERYEDAWRFLAHWLPKPGAIWWGTLCAWQRYRPTPPRKIAAALEAVVQWVQEPTEGRRRAAREAGEAAGAGTPAGLLARGVFYSGGSISLPNLPRVEGPAQVTAECVANAIIKSVGEAPPAEQAALSQLFIQLGLDVSEGKNIWMAAAKV